MVARICSRYILRLSGLFVLVVAVLGYRLDVPYVGDFSGLLVVGGVLLVLVGVVVDSAVGSWVLWRSASVDAGLWGSATGAHAAYPIGFRPGRVTFLVERGKFSDDEFAKIVSTIAAGLPYRSGTFIRGYKNWVILRFFNISPVDRVRVEACKTERKKISVHVGVNASGKPVWTPPPRSVAGLLLAGRPGSGKSVLLSRLVEGYGSMPNARVMVLDGKSSGDFDRLAKKSRVIVKNGDPVSNDDILICLKNMQNRLQKYMQNGARAGTGTIIVIDEVQRFLDTSGLSKDDKAKVEDARRIIQQLVEQGRSFGFFVVLAVQRAEAAVLSSRIRDNLVPVVFNSSAKSAALLIDGVPDDVARLIPGQAYWEPTGGPIEKIRVTLPEK